MAAEAAAMNSAAATQAGIAAGGSLMGSVVNALYDNFQQNKQRQWNEEMMDKQNEWSLNMWNRTNAYNAPSAQLARLRAAGLNPLYYGLDGTSANGLESAQPLGYERSTASLVENPVGEGIKTYQKSEMQQAQIENLNADTAYKSNLSLSEVERRQNLIKERDRLIQDIKESMSREKLNDKQREKLEQYMEYAEDIYQAQIDRDNAFADLSQEQKRRIQELLPGEKELQRMQINDYVKKWAKWSAEIAHLTNQDAVLSKQAKYYLLSLLSSGLYGTGLSSVNSLIMHYITTDPDLTDKEKEELLDVIDPNDQKKGRSRNKGVWRDAPEGAANKDTYIYEGLDKIYN